MQEWTYLMKYECMNCITVIYIVIKMLQRGRAGLHLASELGREDVVDILLANNAFVNVRNKAGLTPLHLASKNGFNNMIKRLVSEHGAHLDACTLVQL